MAQLKSHQTGHHALARKNLFKTSSSPQLSRNGSATTSSENLPGIQIQQVEDDHHYGFDDHDTMSESNMNNGPRRGNRNVVPRMPRDQTLKRQQSENRSCLSPVEPSTAERRAVSVDRRNASRIRNLLHQNNLDPRSSAPAFIETFTDMHSPDPSLPASPIGEAEMRNSRHHGLDQALGHDNYDEFVDDNFQDDGRSTTTSVYNDQISQELETRWILNLSMHFKDRSKREKFFVTYRENAHVWRRVTISVDYRDALPNSLQSELMDIKYQKDKSAKIYESIRESLEDIQFYDTVTNLKLETLDGRLHIHVVEDVNEIIRYPVVNQVTHLGCRRIREKDVLFDCHMSGFVYKVNVAGETLIKKEIPSPETVDEFLYELNALNSLNYSSHVIKFYGVIVDNSGEYVKGLLISYADGGSLIDVIYDHCKRSNHGLDWALKERWARQIVNGLADIHESGFVQGDFTLSNIVIDHRDDAKIIDINRRGCPVGWEPPEATALIESNHRISMYIGVKSDLYQLGMVLWALAMGEDEPEVEGRPLLLGPEAEVPEWYRRVTQICLSSDPRKRKSASLLLNLFPRDGHHVSSYPEEDRASLNSNAWETYANGQFREASDRPRSERSHSEYSSSYRVTGPPAHELWNYRPRGRSPPSPQPSDRGCYSNGSWAANKHIRASYSDIGIDDMQIDEVVQQPTPSPTLDNLDFHAEGDRPATPITPTDYVREVAEIDADLMDDSSLLYTDDEASFATAREDMTDGYDSDLEMDATDMKVNGINQPYMENLAGVGMGHGLPPAALEMCDLIDVDAFTSERGNLDSELADLESDYGEGPQGQNQGFPDDDIWTCERPVAVNHTTRESLELKSLGPLQNPGNRPTINTAWNQGSPIDSEDLGKSSFLETPLSEGEEPRELIVGDEKCNGQQEMDLDSEKSTKLDMSTNLAKDASNLENYDQPQNQHRHQLHNMPEKPESIAQKSLDGMDTTELPVLSNSIASEPDIHTGTIEDGMGTISTTYSTYAPAPPQDASVKFSDSLVGVGAGHMDIDEVVIRKRSMIYDGDFHVVTGEGDTMST